MSRLNTSALVSYHEEDRGSTHEFCLRVGYCNIDEMIKILQDAKELLGPDIHGTADVSIDVGSRENYDAFRLKSSKEYGWC